MQTLRLNLATKHQDFGARSPENFNQPDSQIFDYLGIRDFWPVSVETVKSGF